MLDGSEGNLCFYNVCIIHVGTAFTEYKIAREMSSIKNKAKRHISSSFRMPYLQCKTSLYHEICCDSEGFCRSIDLVCKI